MSVQLKLKFLLLVLLGSSFTSMVYAQTFACPPGTEDMLNYFVMGYPNRVDQHMAPGNSNPIYTSIIPDYSSNSYAANGYFVWTKSSNGYPWDIKTYDSSYIYDRSTELGWSDPSSFKRFNIDLPMSRRCVRTGKSGGVLKIPSSNTTYQSYSQCQSFLAQSLNYVVDSISAPTMVNVGNVGPTQTRYFQYKYSCDQNYQNCQFLEVFSLGLGIGLYDWKYYVNQNGSFQLRQESIIDQLQLGQSPPLLQCTNSYQ